MSSRKPAGFGYLIGSLLCLAFAAVSWCFDWPSPTLGPRRDVEVDKTSISQPGIPPGPAKAVLTADAQGHFYTAGTINGTRVRFIVDTGATLIALGAGDARRIGLDPKKGTKDYVHTANGRIPVSKLKLETVRVGDIVLNDIDAVVLQHEQTPALLGMNFLNRLEMQHSAGTMTLIKRR
jgi:aspartyl protease family protein